MSDPGHPRHADMLLPPQPPQGKLRRRLETTNRGLNKRSKRHMAIREEESEEYERGTWSAAPLEVLLQVFKHLSHDDLIVASQVCSSWDLVARQPELWRHVEIVVAKLKSQATSNAVLQRILSNHGRQLESVVLRIDSSVDSARKVCRILSKLVDCSLKTLSLISSARPVFLDVDQDCFTSALTVIFDRSESLRSLAIDHTPVDDPSLRTLANHCSTLQLLRLKSCPRVSPEGVLALADNCRRLRELSLSYSMLSDDLLLCLSSDQHLSLTNLRVEVYSEPTACMVRISPSSWQCLVRHSPNINLVLNFFTVNEDIYESLFESYNPVTHLYFCHHVPKTALFRVSKSCPRLRELIVNGTDCVSIDLELLDIGKRCPLLHSLGLSECLVSCSAFVEFVRVCGDRLTELFVTEDCLVPEPHYDVQRVIGEVSHVLSVDWAPEFTPLW